MKVKSKIMSWLTIVCVAVCLLVFLEFCASRTKEHKYKVIVYKKKVHKDDHGKIPTSKIPADDVVDLFTYILYCDNTPVGYYSSVEPMRPAAANYSRLPSNFAVEKERYGKVEKEEPLEEEELSIDEDVEGAISSTVPQEEEQETETESEDADAGDSDAGDSGGDAGGGDGGGDGGGGD